MVIRRADWRWILIFSGALLLSACRSIPESEIAPAPVQPAASQRPSPAPSATSPTKMQLSDQESPALGAPRPGSPIQTVAYQQPVGQPPAAQQPPAQRQPVAQASGYQKPGMNAPPAGRQGFGAAPSYGPAPQRCACGSHHGSSHAAASGIVGQGGWIPPKMTPPWASNEYLCDGGDQGVPAAVMKDWSVGGLEQEDTVAHYDTLDGDTRVEASNRVCIYAPRFAAVRKVYSLGQYQQRIRTAGVLQPLQIEKMEEVGVPSTVLQPVQPGRNIGTKATSAFRERTRGVGLDTVDRATGMRNGFMPFEDFNIFKRGEMDNSEKARLSESIEAAIAWSHDLEVQVILDNIVASEAVGDTNSHTLKAYESKDGESKLRLVKVASRQHAAPGDIVEFTLRFDNVGSRTIGNVVIVDNLVTRLEYVEDSQNATREADFTPYENEGESLVLRWEFKEPLEVGEGGVIRFKCRVR